jgi:1-deoxy-D-xylulose-5-phosphate synthase
MLLAKIETPEDLRGLSYEELDQLSAEIREFIVATVTTTGGHLGSNLGVVELTLALHRSFSSPKDAILWDTGHQAYVHKLVTGRRYGFKDLRQAGGLSGYPNREESEHDWIENSHASPVLSYAHGLATAWQLDGSATPQGGNRRVVAVIGDGALTGGMAYEALNNLGHSGTKVLVVLNDNGRSYAPTVSQLSNSLTQIRLNHTYLQTRDKLRTLLKDIPKFGDLAYSSVSGLTTAIREAITPRTFFEALGVRYAGPIDGHDIKALEQAIKGAQEWDGPMVLHVLTQKGRGYGPAEQDDLQRLHDFKVGRTQVPLNDEAEGIAPKPIAQTYTDAFSQALVRAGAANDSVVALTAAMMGPTGLLPFQSAFPTRCFDVGIAESHAFTAAAGMAMGGLRPVVAVYSTFFTRAFDQANLDVALHDQPVVMVFDRAGITGDDGASHHGVLDLALSLAIPGVTVFAPSSAEEIGPMLETALSLEGPSTIRFPKTPARHVPAEEVGQGLSARKVRQGTGTVCLIGVGKMLEACLAAAELLQGEGVDATVWDPRVIAPADAVMLDDAARHLLVVTAEDGIRLGGAGTHLVDAIEQHARVLGHEVPTSITLGIPKTFLAHGKPEVILAGLGLDGQGIAASVLAGLAGSALPAQPIEALGH